MLSQPAEGVPGLHHQHLLRLEVEVYGKVRGTANWRESFTGDIMDSKSTTGGFLYLMGPNICVPLGHMTKKQGAVSHSSTEAEVIALDACLRMDGLPALTLWKQVLETLDKDKIVEKRRKNSNGC